MWTGRRTSADTPRQRPYDVSNLDFFEELKPFVDGGRLTAVPTSPVAAGTADLSSYDTVVAVDRTLGDSRTAKVAGAADVPPGRPHTTTLLLSWTYLLSPIPLTSRS